MDSAVSIVNGWKDLITNAFGDHPLASAILTLFAVGVWLYLERNLRPGRSPTNTLLVLFGWAVGVPIFGAIFWLLGELWSLLKAVAPPITHVLGSLFEIYRDQPILVLSLVAVAGVGYLAWRRYRPGLLPHTGLRFLVLAAGVTFLAHLVGPILKQFVLPQTSTSSATVTPTSASTK